MIEVNDDSRGTYTTNNHIKFKTSMLKSSLCDYSDEYILISGAITIIGAGNDDAVRQGYGRNKEVTFTDYIGDYIVILIP